MCFRRDGVSPTVELDTLIFLPITGATGSSVPVTGVTEAKIIADIEVLTWLAGHPENMETWNSPKPLEISCLRGSPIN
jgi:hypothetical protein